MNRVAHGERVVLGEVRVVEEARLAAVGNGRVQQVHARTAQHDSVAGAVDDIGILDAVLAVGVVELDVDAVGQGVGDVDVGHGVVVVVDAQGRGEVGGVAVEQPRAVDRDVVQHGAARLAVTRRRGERDACNSHTQFANF